MIHVFCRKGSDGARELVAALGAGGKRERREKFLPQKGSLVVCWGTPLGRDIPGVRVLNNVPGWTKMTELGRLTEAGLLVPSFIIGSKAPPGGGYLPRRANHQEGLDFLEPPRVPDFWTKKLSLKKEYRVHVVGGRVIRSGTKLPEEGAHPWVRSLSLGWKISYGEGNLLVRKGVRELAKRALDVLRLDFGSVDVWEDADGRLLVGEVGRRPGLCPGTAAKYAQAFIQEEKA